MSNNESFDGVYWATSNNYAGPTFASVAQREDQANEKWFGKRMSKALITDRSQVALIYVHFSNIFYSTLYMSGTTNSGNIPSKQNPTVPQP